MWQSWQVRTTPPGAFPAKAGATTPAGVLYSLLSHSLLSCFQPEVMPAVRLLMYNPEFPRFRPLGVLAGVIAIWLPLFVLVNTLGQPHPKPPGEMMKLLGVLETEETPHLLT